MRTKKGHPVKNPLFEKAHPRDARGRFRKLTDSERTDRGWLGKVSRAAAPEINQHKPRPSDLPGGHDSMASLIQSGDLLKLRGKDRAAAKDRLQDYFATHTNLYDEKSGIRTQMDPYTAVALRDDGGIEVSYRLLDESGKRVGQAHRAWLPSPDGKSVLVLHARFEIDKQSLRGGGFASRWNQHVENVYRGNGVSEIHLEANMDVGGYAWAKQGYDFHSFDDLRLLAERRARMRPHSDSPEIVRLVQRSTRHNWDAGTAPTPLEWAMAGWTEGAQTWPGKTFLLGASWNGVKKL